MVLIAFKAGCDRSQPQAIDSFLPLIEMLVENCIITRRDRHCRQGRAVPRPPLPGSRFQATEEADLLFMLFAVLVMAFGIVSLALAAALAGSALLLGFLGAHFLIFGGRHGLFVLVLLFLVHVVHNLLLGICSVYIIRHQAWFSPGMPRG